jgi:hypothetical protein
MYVLLYCGVCTGVRLLPPGENPIAVRNNNNNNNNPGKGDSSGLVDVELHKIIDAPSTNTINTTLK